MKRRLLSPLLALLAWWLFPIPPQCLAVAWPATAEQLFNLSVNAGNVPLSLSPAGAPLLHIHERVLARLEEAERREPNPHLQTDIRIAWITVRRAHAGSPIPHIEACYTVLGLHPDRVWPAIVEQRRRQLGREYRLWYDADGNRKPSGSQVGLQSTSLGASNPPDTGDGVSLPEFTSRKKPVRSVRTVLERAA